MTEARAGAAKGDIPQICAVLVACPRRGEGHHLQVARRDAARHAASMRAVGIDFGTTNSALALCEGDDVRLARVSAMGAVHDTFRSVLHFDPELKGPDRKPLATAGLAAIEAHLAHEGGRFIQSVKSYLASRSFQATQIFGARTSLEDLIALIVKALLAEGDRNFGTLPRRAVVGRPVHFVNDEADADGDALAEARLIAALQAAGLDEVKLELEPVAAAYRYEQRLDRRERVLVADFGGGTTDLCLIDVGPGAPRGRERVIGTDGVGLAGDALDRRIIEHAVAPALGKGTTYNVIGGTADVPPWFYGHLARWHLLSFLKSPKTRAQLDTVLTTANDKAKVQALKDVIEEDLGYALHQAVVKAKIALSSADEAVLSFADVGLERTITRADFESWIAPDVANIATALDRLLATTKLRSVDVDRVFMTGGTSLVPAVARIFRDRFGAERLLGGEELTSVAQGLALCSRDAFSS